MGFQLNIAENIFFCIINGAIRQPNHCHKHRIIDVRIEKYDTYVIVFSK